MSRQTWREDIAALTDEDFRRMSEEVRERAQRDAQRREDEEAGRLLREVGQVTLLRDLTRWFAYAITTSGTSQRGSGPTPVAALRDLHDAIGGGE